MLGYALVEYISFECLDELLDDIEIVYVKCNCGTSGILSYTKEVLPKFIKMSLVLLFKFLV